MLSSFITSKSKSTALLLVLASAALLLSAPSVYAQNFSHDGNRWYEIEVSIFTNQNISFQDQEHKLPENVSLTYPKEILELMLTTTSFTYNFNTPEQETDFIDSELILPIIGPEFSPAGDGFRVLDFASDAFIILDTDKQEFTRINNRIDESDEHRLLYHAVWRQPVLNKIQSSAIFIRGGDLYGKHDELEGSITISYNVNRVDIDTQLWLNHFLVNSSNEEAFWSVPNQAFSRAKIETEELNMPKQEYYIDDIALMNETRQMRSNELHYLDHPAFGLIIQIRPYQLPNNFDFETE